MAVGTVPLPGTKEKSYARLEQQAQDLLPDNRNMQMSEITRGYGRCGICL